MKSVLLALLLVSIAASQIAVPSVNDGCCSSSGPSGCCNCCDNTTSFCAGNIISRRCCPLGSGFCGCLSNRGFCSGYVFGDTERVTGQDTFGTCFNQSRGTCTYDPSPNFWVVCPTSFTACPSANGFTCCATGQTCLTNSGASFATCAFTVGGPTVLVPTTDQTIFYNQQYTFRYIPVVAGDTSYQVITGGNNQVAGMGILNQDGSVSINYTLFSFSPFEGFINLTFVEGNVSTTVRVRAALAPSGSTGLASSSPTGLASSSTTGIATATTIDTNNCLPNGCAGGALCCNGECYSTGQYFCFQRGDGSFQLCPRGLSLCGRACYDARVYSCINGLLRLI